MADKDFALPIGHQTGSLSTVQIQIGREYLQPVDISFYEEHFVQGLEIWLPNSTNDRRVYASFNGVINFIPTNGNITYNSIELTINPRTIKQINSISGLLEPAPKKVIYKNLDANSVKNVMEILLSTEYQNALNNQNSNNWHPIMRIKYQNSSIKNYLDNNSSNLSAAINTLTNDFLQGNISFIVNAGDLMGDSDEYIKIVNQISSGITFQNPRLVIIETYEYAGNNLNPKYYYWRLLKNAYHAQQNERKVSLITLTNLNNGIFDHPFLLALSLNLNTTELARVRLTTTLPGQVSPTTNVCFFPIGPLENWNGANINNNSPSDLQWRITNNYDLDFELRRRPGQAPPGVRLCGETTGSFNACMDMDSPTIPDAIKNIINPRVQNIWTSFGQDIEDICRILQVPSDIVVSVLGHESHGVERTIRYEPLDGTDVTKLKQNPSISNGIVDAYVALTTQINSQGKKVDTGWNSTVPTNTASLNNPISPARSNITWNEARQLVAIMPHKCSPGLMQTLISNATARYTWLGKWFANVANEFNVSPFPSNNSERHDWLLTGRHSILAGVANIKYNYCVFNTKWDPVLLYSAYNAGSLVYQNNIWGTRFFSQNYVVDAGRHYNSFQNYISTVECKSRFWKNFN